MKVSRCRPGPRRRSETLVPLTTTAFNPSRGTFSLATASPSSLASRNRLASRRTSSRAAGFGLPGWATTGVRSGSQLSNCSSSFDSSRRCSYAVYAVVNGSFQRYTVAAQARTPMPMTRRNVPMRWPMTDHRVGRCSTVSRGVRVTRTRRTYVVAAAVAAIVTAANASQGAYFSQSWGWVALAFLVPTTVLLILDRVEAPGRLRVAFAALMVALGVWIALSSLWSISTPASLREVERMLVYVAVALAIALVLQARRRCRRHRRGGARRHPRVRRTRSRRGSSRTGSSVRRRNRHESSGRSRWDTGTRSAYWRRSVCSRRSGSWPTPVVQRRSRPPLRRSPSSRLTLYFTFSRGAWAALIIGFGSTVALDPRRFRLRRRHYRRRRTVRACDRLCIAARYAHD